MHTQVQKAMPYDYILGIVRVIKDNLGGVLTPRQSKLLPTTWAQLAKMARDPTIEVPKVVRVRSCPRRVILLHFNA